MMLNRTERVMAVLTEDDLDEARAIELGLTLTDLADVRAILRLDLELSQRLNGAATRRLVADFLRGLGD